MKRRAGRYAKGGWATAVIPEFRVPSPFPGMDPYLEGSVWTSVHTGLAVEIARQLTPRLVPRYVALTQKRFVTATPSDDGFPASEAVPHVSVEVRDTAGRRLVTAIELLSPTNKRGDGRREYSEYRERPLLGPTHLLEIDLLREGHRPPMPQALPTRPYFVLLSRANRRPLTEVWPVSLDQPLPTVPVPLLDGDADVPLDLQQVFTAVYDGFRYDLIVDYTRPPEVPLRGAEAAWAEERLRPRSAPDNEP